MGYIFHPRCFTEEMHQCCDDCGGREVHQVVFRSGVKQKNRTGDPNQNLQKNMLLRKLSFKKTQRKSRLFFGVCCCQSFQNADRRGGSEAKDGLNGIDQFVTGFSILYRSELLS